MITVDLVGRKTTLKGEGVHLTPTEFRIVAVLCLNHERVLTTGEVEQLADVYGEATWHIVNLRKKGIPIGNKFGHGYTITEPVELTPCPVSSVRRSLLDRCAILAASP